MPPERPEEFLVDLPRAEVPRESVPPRRLLEPRELFDSELEELFERELDPERAPFLSPPSLSTVRFRFGRRLLGFTSSEVAFCRVLSSREVSGRWAPDGRSPSRNCPMATRFRVLTLCPIKASIRRISRLRPSLRIISSQQPFFALFKNLTLAARATPSAR